MNELLAPRTPGAAFRAARERQGLSIDNVVEATRIKPHIIEALEKDDYSAIAAPLYGKGFIKIYAERLGLDPAPLIEYYLNYYARTVRPTLKTDIPPPSPVSDGMPVPSTLSRFKESSGSTISSLTSTVGTVTRDALHALAGAWLRMQAVGREFPGDVRRYAVRHGQNTTEPMPVGRYAAIAVAVLVVVVLVASLYYSFSGSREMAPSTAVAKTSSRVATSSYSLRVAEPPPAPYIKLK